MDSLRIVQKKCYLETESNSARDEKDQDITTKLLKMVVINVCNGNKIAVLITDIM